MGMDDEQKARRERLREARAQKDIKQAIAYKGKRVKPKVKKALLGEGAIDINGGGMLPPAGCKYKKHRPINRYAYPHHYAHPPKVDLGDTAHIVTHKKTGIDYLVKEVTPDGLIVYDYRRLAEVHIRAWVTGGALKNGNVYWSAELAGRCDAAISEAITQYQVLPMHMDFNEAIPKRCMDALKNGVLRYKN